MDQPLRKIDLGDDDSRRNFLGGSDSSVILGASPFMTRKELWLEKIGLTEPKEETPAMRRGTTLEAIVADLYSAVKDRKLEVVKQRIIHPEHPFICAHIDRRIMNDQKRGVGVWECKCPSLGIFTKCKREGLQDYYIIQMQHYLGVTGYKWGAFAVFSAELWELLEFDVVPDRELIKIIFQKDIEFWEMIKNGIEPEEQEVEIDSEELKARSGLDPSQVINMDKINPAVWAEITKRYQEAKMMVNDAKELLDLYEQKIKEEMERAGASVADGAGARVYWKEQDGKLSLDKKGFANAHPQAYSIYESWLKRGKPLRPFRAFFPRTIYHE